ASGSIAEIVVREGQAVARGDLLARIDNPAVAYELKRGQTDRGVASAMARADSPRMAALRAQASAISAELASSRRELGRIETLARANSFSPAELDRAKSGVAQLEAKLAANEAEQRALRLDLDANAARQNTQVESLAARVRDTDVR